MSYAVRNTLILLVTLFIIVGLGFAYSKFYVDSKVTSLEEEISSKQTDLSSKQNISSDFAELNEKYQLALQIINEYDKKLYSSNKPDNVYEFLNKVNFDGGNQIDFDFIFSDSIPDNQYGILQSSVSGFGDYEAFISFVNKIENSQLLNKISELIISPGNTEEEINSVNFSFVLDSYYQKTQLFDSNNIDFRINENEDVSNSNPIFPLIQSTIPPNEEGLVNVQTSRIVGITSSRVFLVASGGVVSLKPGDRVYLGYLEKIDIDNKRATFNLNKGGIQEVVTLEVVR